MWSTICVYVLQVSWLFAQWQLICFYLQPTLPRSCEKAWCSLQKIRYFKPSDLSLKAFHHSWPNNLISASHTCITHLYIWSIYNICALHELKAQLLGLQLPNYLKRMHTKKGCSPHSISWVRITESGGWVSCKIKRKREITYLEKTNKQTNKLYCNLSSPQYLSNSHQSVINTHSSCLSLHPSIFDIIKYQQMYFRFHQRDLKKKCIGYHWKLCDLKKKCNPSFC